MSERLPDFLIVGAARCGTSWLAKNLSMHPDVFVPRCKEVHFFDRHYDQGIGWYRSFFADRSERLVGEATPAYLSSKDAPRLIRQNLPDVKIIVVLRDPVERAYSHYWNLVAKAKRAKKGYQMSFEDKVNRSGRFIDEGIYSEKLERYYQFFPGENIKILFYDDLTNTPEAFLQKVCGFLAIDPSFDSNLADSRINASDSKLGSSEALYWLHLALVRVGLNKLGNWIDERNRPSLPPMRPETRSMLLDNFYLKEVEWLEENLDRDLSAWKR